MCWAKCFIQTWLGRQVVAIYGVVHWRIQGGGATRPCPPKAPSCVLTPPPKSSHFFYLFFSAIFFESEFGSILKNSGLNPWSFQFWGYPRLEPRPNSPPPLKPAAGSASGVVTVFGVLITVVSTINLCTFGMTLGLPPQC